MNRLSINISGYIYVADLYSIEDNISINKDFIMIRSLSLIENDVYNNEIFVIDKDIYDLNKESIIYPVVNEVERYSQNISDFLDINNFNSSEFYDNEGNIKRLKCDIIKLYHPDTKTNNSNIIVHVSTIVNNIKFHFCCIDYNKLNSHVSTEFKNNHNVYTEYKEIIIPNITDLLNRETFFKEEIFNINIDNSSSLVYNKDNSTYESTYLLTIPTYTDSFTKEYTKDILDSYNFNNSIYPISLCLYPYSEIEENYYLPNLDLVSNTDIFTQQYNISLYSKLGFDEKSKLVIKSGFNYNTDKFNSLIDAYNYYNNVNIQSYKSNSYTDDDEHEDININGEPISTKYNFVYTLELASDIAFNQIIYKSKNIEGVTLSNTLSDIYFNIPIFTTWDQLPELLVARVIITDRVLNYSFISNFTVITTEYYKYIIKFDNRKIYTVKFPDMDNINFNNKVNCIVQKNVVNNNSVNVLNNGPKIIYKPVFYKVQDLQNIQIRQGITQNIGINLNNYLSKVETFILNIEGTNFIEHARNDFFVIFKIPANKFITTGGTYHISNQDNEYISSGSWTLI